LRQREVASAVKPEGSGGNPWTIRPAADFHIKTALTVRRGRREPPPSGRVTSIWAAECPRLGPTFDEVGAGKLRCEAPLLAL
jgi:hypothetical protein